MKPAPPAVAAGGRALAADIRQMIEGARHQVAQAVNAGLTGLYWQIGTRIRQDILKERAGGVWRRDCRCAGATIGAPTSGAASRRRTCAAWCGSRRSFPDREIVAALRRQLGWTHFKELIPLKDELKRDFYAEMCRVERWSTRTLRQKIDGMLFERTALSKKPDELIRKELAALREEDRSDAGPRLPGPVHARLPRARGHVQREGSGVGDPARDRALPAGAGRGLRVRRAAEAHHARRRRLLPRPPLLPPPAAAARRHRAEARRLQARGLGPGGAVPALARSARAPARRGAAAGHHPLRRQEARDRRISSTSTAAASTSPST